MNKIAIGCDHAAFEEKENIKTYLIKKGYEVLDVGTYSNQSVNYPEFGHKVAHMVTESAVDKGIVICNIGCCRALHCNAAFSR